MDMLNFKYDFKFDLIIIPGRSFLCILEQENQINCLKNIRNHLQDSGKMILNFFNPNLQALARDTNEYAEFGSSTEFINPNNGKPINLAIKQINNLSEQTRNITWRFDYDDSQYLNEMQLKWIYKEEFKLLLRLAGFERWELYGNFDKSEFKTQSDEMVWTAWK